MPTDRPTVNELLESVTEFIEKKVIPGVDSSTAFYSKVALNVLAIVAREVEQGDDFNAAEAASLMSLLNTSGDPESLNKAFAEKIAAGDLDYNNKDIADHLWKTTLGKLAIDNPNYSTLKKWDNQEKNDE